MKRVNNLNFRFLSCNSVFFLLSFVFFFSKRGKTLLFEKNRKTHQEKLPEFQGDKSKVQVKKSHMTLIEVLIASVLTMIILTALSFFYSQVSGLNKMSEKLQKEQFKLSYLEKRLSTIIPKIISPTNPSKDFYFFTSDALATGPSLVFTYDNGVSLSKEHSNHLLGRLFLDQNTLVLASLTSPKRWELYRNPTLLKEVLLENVQSLNFEFYVPPKKDRGALVPQNPQADLIADNQWHKNWLSRYQQLPAIIKIHIKTVIAGKEETITFAFALPKSNMVILL